MKQTKFALLAAVTLAGATLINVAGVQAADVTPGSGIEATANTEGKLEAKATTTAEFNVKAGKLTLDAALILTSVVKRVLILTLLLHADATAIG